METDWTEPVNGEVSAQSVRLGIGMDNDWTEPVDEEVSAEVLLRWISALPSVAPLREPAPETEEEAKLRFQVELEFVQVRVYTS